MTKKKKIKKIKEHFSDKLAWYLNDITYELLRDLNI